MRTTTVEALRAHLAASPTANPRVIVSGNHAVPWTALKALDEAVGSYRLCMLNAPPGVPVREGVMLETPFVGAGMRGKASLAYYPCRLSLVPALLQTQAPPAIVLLPAAPARPGLLSLGMAVHILPQ